MADHEEYKIRKNRLENDVNFKNFKEGLWASPRGTVVIDACASYEAERINIRKLDKDYSISIYPVAWDILFSEWTYLGSNT